VWVIVQEHGALECPVLKFWTEQEQLGLVDALGGEPGDLLLIVAGARRMANHVLGTIRNDLGRPPVHEGGLHFLWVVDFPLFEAISEDGTVHPAHHPFTAPHPDDMKLLEHAQGEELLSVRSQSYDLVLNGWELGSGSVRIHQADLQQQIFDILGIDEATAKARFGFLLDAFRFGAPPHAGFAFGIDRLVAILAGEENIREVIAYPKTQSGADPLTGAPTAVDDVQLRELCITLRKPPAGAKADAGGG
jgi:aspartyl-tRNA synthetase